MNNYVDTLPTILDDKKIQKIDDNELYYVYKKLLSDFNIINMIDKL